MDPTSKEGTQQQKKNAQMFSKHVDSILTHPRFLWDDLAGETPTMVPERLFLFGTRRRKKRKKKAAAASSSLAALLVLFLAVSSGKEANGAGADYKTVLQHDCLHPDRNGLSDELVRRRGESIVVIRQPRHARRCREYGE